MIRKLISDQTLHTARSYIYHKMHSRYWRGHGVHSPFVYELVREVITTRNVDKQLRTDMRAYRKRLVDCNDVIHVHDLGTGSDRDSTVSQIARRGSIGEKCGLLLARMVKAYKPETIVEVGTSLGVSTAYMAKAAPHTPVATIEGCENRARVAVRNFNAEGLDNIDSIVGNFDDVLPSVLEKYGANFVYIDGNHTYEATKRYFEMCCKHAKEGSILIFDDIYWSEGMTRAWQEICADKRIMTSVDVFHMGIVFFRQGCPKQHYRLRW